MVGVAEALGVALLVLARGLVHHKVGAALLGILLTGDLVTSAGRY